MNLNDDWKSFLDFRTRRLMGQQTGIKAIDDNLLGLTGIVGIQGHPGSCKSTLALQIAAHNAKLGHPILFIDRENGLQRLRLRLLCQINKIGTVDILTCSTDALREYVKKGKDTFKNFEVENNPILIDEIHNKVKSLYEVYKKPVIVIVDSIQALSRSTQGAMGSSDEKVCIEKWLEDLDQLKLTWEEKILIIVTSEKTKDGFEAQGLGKGKGTASIGYKTEILFDMIKNRDTGIINLAFVKGRDADDGFQVNLEKVLADKCNKKSFTFMLRESFNLEEEE